LVSMFLLWHASLAVLFCFVEFVYLLKYILLVCSAAGCILLSINGSDTCYIDEGRLTCNLRINSSFFPRSINWVLDGKPPYQMRILICVVSAEGWFLSQMFWPDAIYSMCVPLIL
jgi:hypothetical protein